MNTKAKDKSKKSENPNQNDHVPKGKIIIYQMYKVIHQYLPDLFDRLQKLPDIRKRKQYGIAELLTACITMFLFKEGSRNAMNNSHKEELFKKNFNRLFKMRLPHMDTVEDLLRELKEEELEKLKAALVTGLINQKVFRKFKFLGKTYVIAVDGTGLDNVGKDKKAALHKTHKSGETVYFNFVLDAKLVTSKGFSISLASEWASNEDKKEFDKQDCEQTAFKRLSVKLKGYFPNLPVCIVADGLYPNQTFFKICKENKWTFIVVLQDGNLKSIQEEVRLLPDGGKSHLEVFLANKEERISQVFTWCKTEYRGYSLHWTECKEITTNIKTKQAKEKRFVYITDVPANKDNVQTICNTGRMRWKIENEGFNEQKNLGYEMEHNYSRASFLALKNYYQCLQIAHMINQFIVHSQVVVEQIKADPKLTIKHLWKLLWATFTVAEINEFELENLIKKKYQIRLA
jgi:hypothetical protein